ncbi:hypothetical protein [Proteus phage PM2]|uniref:Uncharacterized protein n=1 Tax=Proteus phage PM2 TaxID=2025809 RepID=A0A249XWY4_9CAUD|nr:hypothetical protein KNT71_gp142 [Proteus phage PM2]ASZ76490.1 hypothetical protein [Proteus phage PM2]
MEYLLAFIIWFPVICLMAGFLYEDTQPWFKEI